MQCIEQTGGVTVYAADKQCNYVQYTLQCTTTLTLCTYVMGLRHGKDKKFRDEVLNVVLLKKHVV
jgi:hypothetical protein